MSLAHPHSFGIYVHVPWCRARCPYCAFNVEVNDSPDIHGWLEGLKLAWAAEAPHFPELAQSLYLGGGTPSLLPTHAVHDLIEALPLQPGAEVTMEANPGTVDLDTLTAFVDAGVNRLSIGVQSLQMPIAQRLGRGHTVTQARTLIQEVQQLDLDSWSLDLIFGVPGQTMAQLEADLDAIIAAQPPHVSLYGLSIEPGTPFAELESRGAIRLPDGDTWREQYDRIVTVLHKHGWSRYEVSNFAKIHHRGQHNEQVWRGGFYAGLGPGAHGFRPDGTRTTTESSVARWQSEPTARAHRPTPTDAAVDHLLSTLRHIDGTTHLGLYNSSRHKMDPDTIESLRSSGHITSDTNGIHLTEPGFAVADGILHRLCATLTS